MSSFINLMADDIWSEADIIRRTEAMIRSEFSLEVETILNRKVSGMALGIYQPTVEEQIEIGRYQAAAQQAQAAGNAARADMALLHRVFVLESADRRLSQPLPPEDATPEELAADEAARAEAQAVLDAADTDALELLELRKSR